MIEQKNPLVLAFVGDAVQTLYVRANLASQDMNIAALHKKATEIVCARSQARKFDELFDALTDIEKDIATRARNAGHNTVPKSCTVAEYHKATALEAVIGYNYLIGNYERIKELC